MCERNGEIERQRERERETEGEQKTASGLAGLGHERSRFFIVGSFVVISCWFRLKQVEGMRRGVDDVVRTSLSVPHALTVRVMS